MRRGRRQFGLSLIEQMLVVATVALLLYLVIPAGKSLFNTVQTPAGVKAMISSALASARAIAAERQAYAGIRFQLEYHPDGPYKAQQYLIFIIHDPESTGLVTGFRAVEGIEPVRLPENIAATDLKYRTYPHDVTNPDYSDITDDTDLTNPDRFRDASTFSIVFSPEGKSVIHEVRVRNRDGCGKTDDSSKDDVFNTQDNVEIKHIAKFYQDDYPNLGLGQEYSRNSFILYERDKFRRADKPYSNYLDSLKGNKRADVFINPYTGSLVQR